MVRLQHRAARWLLHDSWGAECVHLRIHPRQAGRPGAPPLSAADAQGLRRRREFVPLCAPHALRQCLHLRKAWRYPVGPEFRWLPILSTPFLVPFLHDGVICKGCKSQSLSHGHRSICHFVSSQHTSRSYNSNCTEFAQNFSSEEWSMHATKSINIPLVKPLRRMSF